MCQKKTTKHESKSLISISYNEMINNMLIQLRSKISMAGNSPVYIIFFSSHIDHHSVNNHEKESQDIL